MDLYATIRKIKTIEIQSAEAVAIAAVKALMTFSSKSKTKNKRQLLKRIKNAARLLESTRPTEPCMRNALRFILYRLNKQKTAAGVKKQFNKKAMTALNHFASAEKKIAEIGAKMIKNNTKIFTHCHSSTVIGILEKAKKQGKKFKVYNTETRPLLQGRITAKRLAKSGIPVAYFIDSAARLAIKDADLVLMGADAITMKATIINKIGSGMFAEIAKNYKVPVYICTDSWKFDPETRFREVVIERGAKRDVWMAPKGVEVNTLCFERIKPELVKAIISELGVLPPKKFVKKASQGF
jgi:ribose 1,5-bisphosphate isomerase